MPLRDCGQDSGDTLAVGRDGRDAQVVAGAEFTGDGCGGGVTDVQQRPVADDVESYVGADRPIPGRNCSTSVVFQPLGRSVRSGTPSSVIW